MQNHKDEDFFWNCEYCGKAFETKAYADEHEKKCRNRKLRRCLDCGLYKIKNPTHDLCSTCWKKKEAKDRKSKPEDHFNNNLSSNEIHTVYIMFYGKDKRKIGYTNDLNSRIIEIKRIYPENKLEYFREFSNESTARRFEAWLKTQHDRELHKFIAAFQDKIRKVDNVF